MRNVGERGLVESEPMAGTAGLGPSREVTLRRTEGPALSPPTLDEVLLSLSEEEAEWAYHLGPEEFWMWWDRREEKT